MAVYETYLRIEGDAFDPDRFCALAVAANLEGSVAWRQGESCKTLSKPAARWESIPVRSVDQFDESTLHQLAVRAAAVILSYGIESTTAVYADIVVRCEPSFVSGGVLLSAETLAALLTIRAAVDIDVVPLL